MFFVECVNCLELGKLQEKNTKNTKNSPKITRVKYEGAASITYREQNISGAQNNFFCVDSPL